MRVGQKREEAVVWPFSSFAIQGEKHGKRISVLEDKHLREKFDRALQTAYGAHRVAGGHRCGLCMNAYGHSVFAIFTLKGKCAPERYL